MNVQDLLERELGDAAKRRKKLADMTPGELADVAWLADMDRSPDWHLGERFGLRPWGQGFTFDAPREAQASPLPPLAEPATGALFAGFRRVASRPIDAAALRAALKLDTQPMRFDFTTHRWPFFVGDALAVFPHGDALHVVAFIEGFAAASVVEMRADGQALEHLELAQ